MVQWLSNLSIETASCFLRYSALPGGLRERGNSKAGQLGKTCIDLIHIPSGCESNILKPNEGETGTENGNGEKIATAQGEKGSKEKGTDEQWVSTICWSAQTFCHKQLSSLSEERWKYQQHSIERFPHFVVFVEIRYHPGLITKIC